MLIDKIYKKTLTNGLTVLVASNHQIPKVSVQLWYNVGSKDEKSDQKGIAHLIEHMIFKGTKTLSESDINLITRKLSGYCNAFTSNDYTGYLFDFPTQNWHEALPIMADCMHNCTFKDEFLNSEMKAVIQELKMYNDDYTSSLLERMLASIFKDHPYRYPIIGYKRDLWNLKSEDLLKFYRQYYMPNNAILVVSGDVQPEDVFVSAEKYFGHLPAGQEIVKKQLHHSDDIESTTTTLYRDIQQQSVIAAWVVPGMQAKRDYVLDLLSWIIGAGKGSRLYKRIVDELELATELESFIYDLFEHGLLVIQFQPNVGVDPQKIFDVINEEISKIAKSGIDENELMRAIKKTEMDVLALKENNQKLAYLIGKYYLALGDEQYLEYYNQMPVAELPAMIQDIASFYLRPAKMHRGYVLPLPQEEKKYWLALQEVSDEEDNEILSRITRQAEVEDGVHVENIVPAQPQKFSFPRAQTFTLSNGLKVLYHHNPKLPKIDILLDFKAKYYFDPEDKQGLSVFLFDMLEEGTLHYDAQMLAQEVERHGMSLDTFPGHISMSMLSADVRKGCELLLDILKFAKFDAASIEKVRSRILADVVDFWDSPSQFAAQLLREKIYHGHPYSKRMLGSPDSIRAITQGDLRAAYKRWLTPQGSRLAIVGDLSGLDIQALLEELFGSWQGPEVPDMLFPALHNAAKEETINYPINRDQVTLCFGKLSVERKNPDFDKLLLFEQVFTGGVLGSMSSRLFELRERSGLFYTIGGSLLAGAGKQPGMLYIKTIVSQDRLAEAEKQIKAAIVEGAKNLTDAELEEAQSGLINSLVDNFAVNSQIAATFVFLDTFGLPQDYFDNRANDLLKITVPEVQAAAAKLLTTEGLITVRVGRI